MFFQSCCAGYLFVVFPPQKCASLCCSVRHELERGQQGGEDSCCPPISVLPSSKMTEVTQASLSPVAFCSRRYLLTGLCRVICTRSNGSHAQVLALKKMGREGAPWAPSSFLRRTDGGGPQPPFPVRCSRKGADPGQRRAFGQLS